MNDEYIDKEMEKKFLELELDEEKSLNQNYNINPELYKEELNNLSISDDVYIIIIYYIIRVTQLIQMIFKSDIHNYKH